MSSTDKRPEGRCWPWSHDWSKWRMLNNRLYVDVRTCMRCGRRKTRVR